MHVDKKTDHKDAAYDMIIGMDLMADLGLIINLNDKEDTWEGASVPAQGNGHTPKA